MQPAFSKECQSESLVLNLWCLVLLKLQLRGIYSLAKLCLLDIYEATCLDDEFALGQVLPVGLSLGLWHLIHFAHIHDLADLELALVHNVDVQAILAFLADDGSSLVALLGHREVHGVEDGAMQVLEEGDLYEELLLFLDFAPIDVIEDGLVVSLRHHSEYRGLPANNSSLSWLRFVLQLAALVFLHCKLAKRLALA